MIVCGGKKSVTKFVQSVEFSVYQMVIKKNQSKEKQAIPSVPFSSYGWGKLLR